MGDDRVGVGRREPKRKETRKSQREASLSRHCKSLNYIMNEPIPEVAALAL